MYAKLSSDWLLVFWVLAPKFSQVSSTGPNSLACPASLYVTLRWKGTRSRGTTSQAHLVDLGMPKRSRELLWIPYLNVTGSYRCTSGKTPMCFPRHSGGKIPAEKHGGGRQSYKTAVSLSLFFLSPIKDHFLRWGKATLCFLTKQWSTCIFNLNCPLDSLNFMTAVQVLTFPLNRWTEAFWLLHFKTISLTS